MSIINIGSINIDHVYRVASFVRPGETATCLSYDRNLGGKGMNQSIALIRAGLQVCHVGVVGQDDAWVRDAIGQAGVGLSHVAGSDQATGHAIIQVDANAENCILLHPGANHGLERLQIQQALEQHPGHGWVLTQNETNRVEDIIELAVAAGRRVAFNPAPCNPELARLPLEKLALLVINEVEAEQLTGHADPQQALDALRKRCPQTLVVVTLGAQGLQAALGEQIWRQAAMPTTVVDTTGAGDTITGYLLASLIQGLPVDQALARAARAAAITVSRSGAAQSIPTHEEVA